MVMFRTPTKAKALIALLGLSAAASHSNAITDCLGMQVHAHRGSYEAPENSIESLQKAYVGEWGGVEVDLQTLQDGAWALHHDRLTGRVVNVGPRMEPRHITPDEWKSGHMLSRQGKRTSIRPGLLTEALPIASAFPSKVFNAEIKQLSLDCRPLRNLVAQLHEIGHGNWFLTSVDRRTLSCVRNADPDGYLGLIVLDPRNAQTAMGSSKAAKLLARNAVAPTLSYEWLKTLKRHVGGPVGVHVDVTTLQANPDLYQDAAELEMPVFTYSMKGDSLHAEVLAFMAKRTRHLPSGIIIDDSPTAFCKKLKDKL